MTGWLSGAQKMATSEVGRDWMPFEAAETSHRREKPVDAGPGPWIDCGAVGLREMCVRQTSFWKAGSEKSDVLVVGYKWCQ